MQTNSRAGAARELTVIINALSRTQRYGFIMRIIRAFVMNTGNQAAETADPCHRRYDMAKLPRLQALCKRFCLISYYVIAIR